MRKMLIFLMAVACSLSSLAQEKTISGIITDDKDNSPLAGVSVMVKGTSIGTVTTAEGKFSLSVPATAKFLVVTLVDYVENEVAISSKTSYAIKLTSTSKAMSEVVVVAYGNQRKESITGSVAVIGAEQLQTRMTTNITQALAGAAPGIAATSGNGQPGSSAAIRIRGFGSVNASNSPLYVVDGFPYEGFIGDLNTNDIESISLLKDASSTALYGARAANGVVVVTTKKGKKGFPKINVTATTGISQRGIAEYDQVGTLDYYPIMWQSLKNSLMFPATGTGLSEAAASTQASNTIASQLIYNPFNVAANAIVGTDGKLNSSAKLLYNDFDWFKALSINGKRREVGFNISSKVDKTDYFVSLNYLKDEGFVIKSDFERVNARINLNTQLKEWLRSGINMSGIFVTANQANAGDDNTSSIVNPFVFARGIAPIFPVRAYDNTGAPVLDANGNHYYDYGIHPGAINRPQGAYPGRHVLYETMLNKSITSRNSVVARTFLEAKVMENLTFTTNLGIDLNNTRSQGFQNKIVGDGVTAGGTSSRSANEYRTISMNQLLNYKKKFKGNHDLNVLLGHENQWVNETYFSGNRRGMNLDGNYELVNFVTLNAVTGSFDQLRRDAYFSRINYGINNRYFLDISYRRDASSRFAPESRWGNFYSVGASWSVIRESFLQNINWLSDLKVRAAYGTVGNDALDSYYAYQALYSLGWNNAAEPGALASTLSNLNLTWEVNKTASVGLDFGFFKNKISGTVEMFDRGSSRLLFDVPQGLSSVVTSRTENIGSMSNKGLEVQLNADLVETKNFKWDVQVNFTTLKNTIKKLPNGQAITSGTKRLEEGRDIYAFYLRQFYGVDQTDGSSLYWALPGITSGYRVTSKGDTVVTNPTNARFGYSGSAIPKYFGSFSTSFSFKGFTVSGLFNYQIGGKFYDGVYASMMTPSYGKSLHADALKSWNTAGGMATIPRIDISSTGNLNAQSSRFLIDASYISLRNFTVGYNFSRGLLSKMKFDQVKIYLSGENIFVKSKRKGLNPAESFNGTNSNIYVPNRIISGGINFTF
jgi:TonB-linked SusC/RagA family outer membrane protein